VAADPEVRLVERALPVLRNFVDGSYVDPADGKASPVVDPCTGEAYTRRAGPTMWSMG
jgi:hypothetical protein